MTPVSPHPGPRLYLTAVEVGATHNSFRSSRHRAVKCVLGELINEQSITLLKGIKTQAFTLAVKYW